MGTKTTRTGVELVAPADASMREWAETLVARSRAEGVDLVGADGLLTALLRTVLQTGMEVELAEHLGYERNDPAGRGSGNSRNGYSAKTVATEIGDIELKIPRDRNATFEPLTVPKHVRRLDGLNANVLSLYAKGLTTGEIQAHLVEIYGTEVSRDTISRITDAVIEEMTAWQNRPLDRVYPVVLIDAIVVKVRDSQVANRPVYVAIGVNMDGERDVLGLWLGPSGGEGAKQWMTMLTELRNRGLADVLIVCCDGLKGLPDAIRMTWPLATVQTSCGALGPQQLAVRVEEALGPDHERAAGDLHGPDRPGRGGPFRRVLGRMGRQVPGHDPLLGTIVGRIRAVPRVPPRAATHRLHDQRNRVAQRPVPPIRAPPRPLPDRPSSPQGPLPHRHRKAPQQGESDRADQRLETDTKHAHHPLRRPNRRLN